MQALLLVDNMPSMAMFMRPPTVTIASHVTAGATLKSADTRYEGNGKNDAIYQYGDLSILE
jgi:hypothetical protein